MRVLVSATKEDLDPDCRPAVRRAIALCDAQAETMAAIDTLEFIVAIGRRSNERS